MINLILFYIANLINPGQSARLSMDWTVAEVVQEWTYYLHTKESLPVYKSVIYEPQKFCSKSLIIPDVLLKYQVKWKFQLLLKFKNWNVFISMKSKIPRLNSIYTATIQFYANKPQ